MYLRNFALLAEGMHLLLAAKISEVMVRRAEVVLNDFYYEAQDICGKLAYKFISSKFVTDNFSNFRKLQFGLLL